MSGTSQNLKNQFTPNIFLFSNRRLLNSKNNNLPLLIVTVLGLLYLAAIPLNLIENKFETTEVVIFAVILLFNSELLERLEKLVVNKDGVTLEISELKAEQEKQKAKIEANSGLIQRQILMPIEQAVTNTAKPEVELIIKNLLNQNE